jgi:hypothetical protein
MEGIQSVNDRYNDISLNHFVDVRLRGNVLIIFAVMFMVERDIMNRKVVSGLFLKQLYIRLRGKFRLGKSQKDSFQFQND